MFLFIASICLTFYFAWTKSLPGIAFFILTIFTLERILHTTYTIVPDKGILIIYKGRFSHREVISLDEVELVEKRHINSIFRIMGSYVLLKVKSGYIGINPSNEDEFVRVMNKCLCKNSEDTDEED